MQVGTKELKNRLSHYLRLVRRGEVVHVTAHGKVVAVLQPVEEASDTDEVHLAALEEQGLITLGSAAHEDFAPIDLPPGASASQVVIEDRR